MDCHPGGSAGCTAATCCCDCHAGYYCPGGATDQPEDKCPAGSTSPPKSTAASDCTGGPPGPPGPPGPSGCAPSQLFINYADSPDQMRVSWATACQATAAVAFGASPGSLTTVTGPAPSQYKAPSYTSPYLYHVTLTGLTPGAQYYYQVGDATSGKSALLSFKAHPGVGADIPTTVAVIGDPGQTDNSASTYAHVSASKADYVTIVGDLSYADSVETRWDSWGDMISNMSAVLPTMITVGVRAACAQQPLSLFSSRPSPQLV